MRRTSLFGLVCAIALFTTGVASASHVGGTAVLTGFIQNGTITNTSATQSIDQVVYSLGTPEDNLATWDGNGGSALGGGTPSDFLSNPNFFQTVTWSGLSVAPSGGTFSFSGLDIDLILTVSPLSTTGSTLGGPTTLRNAYIQVHFTDGSTASASLVQQSWSTTQNLTLVGTHAVPEPSSLALLGIGGIALTLAGVRRRKNRQV